MIEPKIENLYALGQEIAVDKGERFGTEHIAQAMDLIIPGSAYYDGKSHTATGELHEADTLEVKLEKLYERTSIYLQYDRLLAEKGYQGNREIDAAIKRISVWDANIGLIKTLHKDKILSDAEYRLSVLSLMCKTNGMFLGREVLNRDFTFYTHGPVFDFFVQKNPCASIPQQDLENKIRLLEMPRGAFKSVSDGIDCVQWIVVNPDVRIVFLTASLGLAKEFVGEIKNYFTVDVEDKGDVSPFQDIFSRDIRFERPKKFGQYQRLNFLISEGKEGKESEFICPARTKADQATRGVTIWAGSVGAGKVGKHCDILKADDAVDEKNTDTPKVIAKTKKRIGMASKLVDPGGYKDNLGTPYAPNDWYNHIRMDVKDVLTLIRPAKWLKRDINGATAIDHGTAEKDLRDNDWTLLFPCDKHGVEKLSYKNLQGFQEEDPEGFPSQYMLDPHGYKKVSFPESLLYQQTIGPEQMPTQTEKMPCYILWDLADTQGVQSDYSVGAVLTVDRENRGYIVEIFRDRYTFHDLCYVIAKSNHDYKPLQIIIENARGAEKLRGDMTRAAQDMGDKTIPLNFVKVNNTKSAKAVRIGKLEPRLRDRMLYFLNTISCYQDLITEFRDFGSAAHDDIPDAIGFCEYVLPDLRSAPADPVAAAAAQRILDEKQFFEMIHGSPEDAIRAVEVEPLVDESPGTTAAGELWDPFSVGPARQ